MPLLSTIVIICYSFFCFFIILWVYLYIYTYRHSEKNVVLLYIVDTDINCTHFLFGLLAFIFLSSFHLIRLEQSYTVYFIRVRIFLLLSYLSQSFWLISKEFINSSKRKYYMRRKLLINSMFLKEFFFLLSLLLTLVYIRTTLHL